MDDSDEYVFDDIILDEQTLATLDQQERQFLGESSHGTSASASEPVNKRFKTNNGWTPGPANIDYDEMPEICLQRDGTYVLGNPVNALTVSMPKLAEQKSERSVSSINNYPVTIGHLETDFSRGVTLPQNMLSGPSTSRLPLYPNNRQKHALNSGNSKTTSFRRTESTVNNVGANPRQLPDQMSELQKKLDELREENSKIQTALQDAIDVKLAKEGEVSILRKSVEKTSQTHAAQIAQLKAEKEKADLKQAQMQKEMKDELERLRTQFVFKQQELESSIRMGSVRGKKTFRELPSTPLPIPYAMRSWSVSDAANSRRTMEDTPQRPSQLPPISKTTLSEYPRKSPEKQKKLSMLPGFQNAFETSTPMRSPSKRLNKGKGRMEYDQLVADAPFYNTPRGPSQQNLDILQFPPQEGFNGSQESAARPLSPSPLMLETGRTKDKGMDSATINDESEEAPIHFDSIEDVNWKRELSRIILTHSHPSCGSIIFQHLLGLAGSVGSCTKYTASCGKILEVVASSSKVDDYEESLHAICRSLLSILVAINETQQLNSLAMLLDLFRELILSLPKVRVILLCSRIAVDNEGGDTSLLDILSKVILEHVQPTKTHIYRDALAKEILSLLESLCFSASPEAIEKLGSILRNREVLMVLMHISQPVWLLDQSSRLLVLLSTHHTLFRVFLNIPSTDMIQNTGTVEMTRDPLIERLCSHLIEAGGLEPETYKLQILTCFAQLSIAHSDAHAALAASYVVPSLVLFVTHLATPLWEDNGKLSSSPSITSSIIQTLNQAIMLLYSLIFRTEPALNLRHILQHAPHRPFNSINNIFVVTFGRLSYCDSPGWIDAERRQELENLCEIAREILEVVVDGPEGDNVWAAFQTEPEEDSALDDEEIEARRMGVEA